MMAENGDGETLEICGIDGRHDDPVTKGELNLFIRRVKIFHLGPMKKQVSDVHTALFDEKEGIVSTMETLKTMRRWICYGATWAAALVLGGITLMEKLAAHGWWFR